MEYISTGLPQSEEEIDKYIKELIQQVEEERGEENISDNDKLKEEKASESEGELQNEQAADETQPEEENRKPKPLPQPDTSLLIIHEIVAFFDWLFSPKIIMRISLLIACSLLLNFCYYTVLEALNRPVIVKAKQARPFFSNSSSRYITDYFTGNAKPDHFLGKTDLLVVMYYSPWSTLSVHLKHSFEVVAKFLHVKFIAINCWAAGSLCRNSYKLMNYPVIAAYSGKTSVMYTGTPSTDHLYRWVVRLQNHMLPINSMNELERIKATYQNVLIGYFPFKRMKDTEGLKAFAAAGFLIASGNPQDDALAFGITYSLEMAKHLGFRYEGDIQLLRGPEDTEFFPMGRTRTAINILDFARKNAIRNGQLRYISRPQEIVQSYQITDIVNHSPVLILVTPFEPIYSQQDEVVLFSQIADDYWKCDIEVLSEEAKTSHYSRLDSIRLDEEACNALNLDPIELDNCCRSQLTSIDWNIACASSTKYRWEGEEESHKRRNHWTEEVLLLNPQCSTLKTLSADQLVHRCCEIYENISNPYCSNAQKILYHEKLQNSQNKLINGCIRRKLAEHFEYSLKTTIYPFVEDENLTTSIQGFGCKRNDSLQFAVLDSKSDQYFLKKWGISNLKQPYLVLVDSGKELFVVLNSTINQSSIQQFIRDFHGNLLNDYMLDENYSDYRQRDHEVEVNIKITSQEIIPKLTRKSFLTIIDNDNSTFDQVIFFTGGVSHAPSTSVLFTVHTLSQYFDRTKELIRFYTVDVSKNEMPYNFNFESIPSIVLFLAGRRDVSWKYPEMLPVTAPNLISFIVSRCSPKLRWKLSLLNCDYVCIMRNIHKLRRFGEEINYELHLIPSYKIIENQEKIIKWRESKIDQLSAVHMLLRALATGSQTTGLNERVIERLLRSEQMYKLITTNLI